MTIQSEIDKYIIEFLKSRLLIYSSDNGGFDNFHMSKDEILKFTYKIQSDYLLASEKEKNVMKKKMPNILDLINKNEFMKSQSIRAQILFSASLYLEEFENKMELNKLSDLENSDYYKSRISRVI